MAASKPVVWMENNCWYYSPSGLGRCIRGLTAARMGIRPMDTSKHQATQLVFKEGDLHESAITASLKSERGLEVINSQRTVTLHIRDNIYVQGHIDGEIGDDLVEFKSMSDNVFKTWMRSGLSDPYFYGYAVQLTCYMAATHKACRYFAKNRNTGQMDERYITVPPLPIHDIIARIEKIEEWAELDSFPFCDKPSFPCPYYHIHEPDTNDATNDELPEALDDLVDSICIEYDRAAKSESQAKARKQLAKEKLEQVLGESSTWKKRGWEVKVSQVTTNRLNQLLAKEILKQGGRLEEAMEVNTTTKLSVKNLGDSSKPPSSADPTSGSSGPAKSS